MTEFHQARLVALDNWSAAESALSAQGDRVGAISKALGVSDLGAQSVLAMAGRPLPHRSTIASELSSMQYLQRMLAERV
ncbi:MAG: hypothetical protein L0K86_13205 [Actinomycetia bacterium]|nr:hypothetical protein [Actinomycetes bacterium]